MKTGYSVIDKLAKKHTDKISSISDERSMGDGFWIYLGNQFCNREMEPHGGMHIIHEGSPSNCISQLRKADKCNCEDCLKEITKTY